MPHHRHEWCDTRSSTDQQDIAWDLGSPDKMFGERPANLDAIAHLGHAVKVRRDLTVIEEFHGEFEGAVGFGR